MRPMWFPFVSRTHLSYQDRTCFWFPNLVRLASHKKSALLTPRILSLNKIIIKVKIIHLNAYLNNFIYTFLKKLYEDRLTGRWTSVIFG